MRFILAIAGLLAAVSATAQAADTGKKKDESVQYVSISPVAIPVVVEGKIVNYVFVVARLDLTKSANSSALREREPYFRDALVRAAHRTPFTLSTDYTKIDEGLLKAALMRDATALAGPGAIRSVTIMSQAPKSRRVVVR